MFIENQIPSYWFSLQNKFTKENEIREKNNDMSVCLSLFNRIHTKQKQNKNTMT